jgi:HSP90 family molecular chaperone
VEPEEYVHFYRSLAKRDTTPLEWAHFSVEGQINFRAVLFIPERVPFDFFQNYNRQSTEVKLYVRRVLITDTSKELLPKYLSFMLGVVDSDELDLNVNRETIQHTKSMQIIN